MLVTPNTKNLKLPKDTRYEIRKAGKLKIEESKNEEKLNTIPITDFSEKTQNINLSEPEPKIEIPIHEVVKHEDPIIPIKEEIKKQDDEQGSLSWEKPKVKKEVPEDVLRKILE